MTKLFDICELELPAPPAICHGKPSPRRVRPGARPAVKPAGPRRPRVGMVEVLPLRAAGGARGRRRFLHLRRGLRVPAAVPPRRSPGGQRAAALRRRLPRHHHQEGVGVQGPGARPPARSQRPRAHLPLPRRDADHPQHRGVGRAWPRLARRPLAGVRHLDPRRQGHGQGRRRPHDVPLQRAVPVGAGGEYPAQGGEAVKLRTNQEPKQVEITANRKNTAGRLGKFGDFLSFLVLGVLCLAHQRRLGFDQRCPRAIGSYTFI